MAYQSSDEMPRQKLSNSYPRFDNGISFHQFER